MTLALIDTATAHINRQNVRRRGRTDGNQAEVVAELRKVGATVAITSGLGKGFPDLVVGFRGKNYLLEDKDESQPPSKRRLTKDEQEFHRTWRGTVHVVESPTDALRIIGALQHGTE